MRRCLVLLACAATLLAAVPAHAQTTSGEFGYSPEAQERGRSITVTGRCINGGSTDNVDMVVTVQEGADGNGSFRFSKTFLPSANGNISGSIEVPGDAPYGEYVITGACRSGPIVFFTKNGPFSVVQDASAATTAPPRATTTTSSTSSTSSTSTTVVEGEETTTTTAPLTELSTDVEDDDDEATTTTIDEFAGTRNEDDDSIGPLLLLVGVVPLALAAGAIALALRRSRRPGGDPTP